MQRTLVNHGIIFTLFVFGALLVTYGTIVFFNLVLPYADGEARALAAIISFIVWILSWILRGLYISNRDLSIESMGEVSLKTYIGICQEIYERKYGKK